MERVNFLGANVVVILLFLIIAAPNGWGADYGAGEPGILVLNLDSLAQLVKEKNNWLLIKELEWEVRKEGVNNARSIFEPEVTVSFQRAGNQEQKLAEDWADENSITSLVPIEQDIRDELNDKTTVAVEKIIQTGAVVRLAYDYDVLSNQYNEVIKGTTENQTFLGVSLKQPLLRNAGSKVTMANIHIAEADADVEFQTYRQQLMRTMLEAMGAYWDYYLNQEKYKIRQASIKIAEQILAENRERVIAGKMAETEVLEAETGLLIRRSYASAARQALVSAKNNLLIYLSSSVADQDLEIHATEEPTVDYKEAFFETSLDRATKRQPEYLAARKKMDQADIRIAYMKNQRWPQLDLNASYGLNGLDSNFGGSWNDAVSMDYVAWAVGLELKVLLQGGIKSRSELNAAQHRKRQALLELKAVETRMANMIDASIKSVGYVYDQVKHYSQAEKLTKQLLDIELLRLEGGKSTSKVVFDREEEFIKARESRLESLVNYQKVLLSLAMAEGTLLEKYQVEYERMEID
jgi:outer membrane protein TolC